MNSTPTRRRRLKAQQPKSPFALAMEGAETEAEKTPDPDTKRTKRQTQAFLKTARDRFQSAQSSEKEQRQRELDDLKFYAGEQWPDDVKTQRAGQNASNGLPPVPARPCITINETRAPVRNVLNQERNSDLGIELIPADDFGEDASSADNDAEIDLREGLIRRIQRESHAKVARTWAFARAVQAGRGYYQVNFRYLPGKTMDQEIYVDLIYNQAAVTLDPAHQQPDGSDAEWEFIGTYLPWSKYTAKYPRAGNGRPNQLLEADDDDFRALGENYPSWFKMDGEQRAVHVARYYYAEYTERELIEWSDGQVFWKDELPLEVPPAGITVNGSRFVQDRTVRWAEIDGWQILDEGDWPGPDMPIVQILGEELQPYDEQKRIEGMVRPAREGNQGLNYMISKWVEMIGLTPIPPLHVAEGQIEGYEEWYKAATTRALPYLPYRTRDLEGNPVVPPFAVNRETPIQAVASSVQMFHEKIQNTLNVHEPSLGQVEPALKSGKAINAIISADLHGTSNFLDNLVRSMEYEGKVENNLLYPIYGRKPGRLARIINPHGDPETILINKPFAMSQGPRPRPMPVADPTAQGAKTYKLTPNAQFNVAVKVSKNFDTRRQQEASITGELLSANPELMGWFGDIFFKNLDGPGHQEMSERAKVMLDPKIQQMIADKKQGREPLPPQVQQQLAQGQQVIEGLTQAVQQLEQEKQAKFVEQQGKLQIEREKQQAENQRNTEDNEVRLAVAELGAKVDRIALFLEESRLVGARQDAQREAQHDRAHDVAMAAMNHDQTLEQTEQQAALQPEPENNP